MWAGDCQTSRAPIIPGDMSVIYSDPRDEGGTGLYDVYVAGNLIGSYSTSDEAKQAEQGYTSNVTQDAPGYGTNAIAGSVNATSPGPEAGRDTPFFDTATGKYYQNVHYANGSSREITLDPAKAIANGAAPGTVVPTNPNATRNDAINGILNGVDTSTPAAKVTTLPGRAPPQNAFPVGMSSLTAKNIVGRPASPFANIDVPDSAKQALQGYNQAATAKVTGQGDKDPYTAPGAEAPKLDRDKINSVLGGLDSYSNSIADLAKTAQTNTVAEARLTQAADLAQKQAAINTEQSQSSALGAARSTRNRGDRALAERQAIGESAYIGQDASRTAALTEAQTRGDLASLRAQEADADRTFRLSALSKAADLGLNRAALEVDISKTNLSSATNWINQEFDGLKQNGQLDLGYAQLDEQKTQAALGFTRDMAAIQLQYDQMDVQDQQFVDSQLMQKYGIDQGTMIALKQLKASKQVNWGQVLTSFIGGAGAGLTSAITAGVMPVKK